MDLYLSVIVKMKIVTEMQCDKFFPLHLGMDGPNVNLASQKRLQNHLLTQNSTILDIGTCLLHTIRNGFSEGARVIDFDIEQFTVDINAFFNLLSANPTKWSNILKQFVGCCRRIV